MTNKFRKWSQVWAAHDEVWINLWPQTIVGLASAAVDLTPVGTSRGVCLGYSWHYTGRFWQRVCFLRSVFCVCKFRTRQTLRNWSKITSGQRHLITLYDWEMDSYPLNPTVNFLWNVLDGICHVKEEEWKTYSRSLALLAGMLWREKVRLVKVHVFRNGPRIHLFCDNNIPAVVAGCPVNLSSTKQTVVLHPTM